MRKVLILGATSAIAQQTAKLFAAQGDALFLAGRNAEKLAAISSDLKVRGAGVVEYKATDFSDFEQHAALLAAAEAALGGLEVALIAYGTLGDQKAGERDFKQAEKELSTNLLSVLSLLTLMANRMERQGFGCLAAISSVAGDRGRQSNYIYGTAKGGLSVFLQGLRNRLAKKGVQVLTIKPGFVDTPMTVQFKKGILWVGPEVVARSIYKGIVRKKDVVYAPWFWRIIMLVIKCLPEAIFKRLSL
jgi:short-subunit dehydrogenase